MKLLPKLFRKGGFDYEQVFRDGSVAIYRQTKKGQYLERFEVGRIRENQARETFGKHFEASESWPSSEEWGVRAYTCTDLARAKERAATLTPSDNQNALNL